MPIFAELLDDAALLSLEHQLHLADLVGEQFSVDIDLAVPRFDFLPREHARQIPDGSEPDTSTRRVEAPLTCTATHLLGSAAPGPRSWLWAWANPAGYPPATVALSERVRQFGMTRGIAEFTNPEIPFDALPGAPGDALRVVSQMVDAVKAATGQWTGYQLSAGGGTYAGFIIEHPSFRLPAPEGPRVSRALMQGLKELPLHDHHRALRSYAAGRGFDFRDDGHRLVLTGPGFSATARFDSAQRVSELSWSFGAQ